MTHLRSVRGQATAAAMLVFAVVLVIGAVGLVSVIRRTMLTNIDTSLGLRAEDIAGLLDGGAAPNTVAVVDEEDSLVQIVQDGKIIASSTNIEGEEPIIQAAIGTFVTTSQTSVDDSTFRILVADTNDPNGPIIIVGNTIESVDETTWATIRTLGLGIPFLVIMAGGLTWALVGRSLRPVEAIRAEVADIGATDLHRRVPQPGSADEIARLADTMNQMLDRIESGTERQRRFVSDASHELRTPIAIIRHELEVSLQHPDTTDWPVIAGEILEEDLRMQRMVDDLLWLARHDQGQTQDRKTLVDLDEIAGNQVRRQRAATGVPVDSSGIGAGQVRGNADDLSRVVQNLLDNAARHATSKVAVSLETTESGTVQLHVDDDGPGIAPDRRDKVFERFTRSDEARARDVGGAGLGLAIASEIAGDHDGSLAASDSPLGGARFTLQLPDARCPKLTSSPSSLLGTVRYVADVITTRRSDPEGDE